MLVLKVKSLISSLLAGIITIVGAAFTILFCFLGFSKVIDKLIEGWAKTLLRLAGINLEVEGRENIPDGPCLFIFNHASLLDICVLFASIPRRIRFGAKKELFYIPIFGWALHLVGMLKIDRNNRHRAIQTLKNAAGRVSSGEYFALAAEGTRQREPMIGEFKSGPFVLAIQAKAAVVPVVIEGIQDVLPKNAFIFNIASKHNVKVRILKPIETGFYSFEQRHELKSLTHTRMVNNFEELKKSRIKV